MMKQADNMTLYDILPLAKDKGIENCIISLVTDNTENVCKDCIFVCIKGAHFDGHTAAEECINKGAAAVVVDHDMGLSRQIITSDTRLALARLSSMFYNDPTQKLQLFGVTGTNGKTTTAHLIKHILTALNKKCGIIGTAGNDLCDGRVTSSVHGTPTTPASPVLYSWFDTMVKNNGDCCVMEVSSQALAQHRIKDEHFTAAGFTNLTQDHLDYHGSMENYFLAKAGLFEMTDNRVISIDDEYGIRLAEMYKGRCLTVSVNKKADIYARFIRMTAAKTEFILMCDRDETAYKVSSYLTGLYNIQNILVALGMLYTASYDLKECISALASCKGVEGRMNVIYNGDFTVIIDYAHTDDALSKVLGAINDVTPGRLICLFGAAGDRDSKKRPLMARAVQKYADIAIVTSDNPAHENPEDIINEVCTGFTGAMRYEKITDRRKAISYALKIAGKGDVIALCGKGHEKYQIINDEYIPFCEEDIVNSILSGKEN